MKILVDENIPLMTINELRIIGHDVLDIRGSESEGLQDEELWDIAQKESRLLITTDKGFTRYYDTSHSGILIVRLRQPNRYKIHMRVMLGIKHFQEKEWPGKLVTMRDKTINIKD